MAQNNIFKDPLHLGLGATVITQPPFTGMEWYQAYAARHSIDGAEGRLVSAHKFSENWDMWEMHPHGDEAVICISGCATLHQELTDGEVTSVTLSDGDFVINPRGIWHTADVSGEVTMLFITAGLGTEHRPR
jgi:mannose-6-phosphate isomerase-like protein (cupin superfamily)